MKQRSRVVETRLSLPKSISPSSDSLSTVMLVAIKFTDDFTSNLSRIPHESIPSLFPTSFSADFNLKENTSALLSPNRLSFLFANKKTFPFSIISFVMGLDYSYTQPSDSEEYGLGISADSGNSSTEMNILLDQAEIEAARVQYPPQPEVEFSFPKECYCSGEPLIRTSYTTTDPGRRFFTCENIDDGDCHVHKWWDVAATEEIKAIGTQYNLLSDKVDYVASVSDSESELNQVKDLHYETKLKLAVLEKTVSELSKNKSHYELVLGGL
ncbi:hypothetical protein IGI04_003476, partial [Brassica rapa subsp. trilocularis]